MNNYIFTLLVFSLISCNNENNIELYFFEDNYFTSDVPITCGKIEEERGLLKLIITEHDNMYDKLININKQKNDKSVSFNQPDVRYKLKTKSDIICISNTGILVLNDSVIGKTNILEDIRVYIDKNKKVAIEVTQPREKPWLNYEGEIK
jgi:hypothetical protein